MKINFLIQLYMLVAISLLNAQELTNKYRDMMDGLSPTNSNTTKSQDTPVNENYNIIDTIQKIDALKQDTFESTNEFNMRREKKITDLQNKVIFFARNASSEYSAGAASMKNYNADSELMQLTLQWNDGLKTFFPEIKNLQTVFLKISRKNAKELFADEKKHFFHIDVEYQNNHLKIKKMALYDKYELYIPVEKKKIVVNKKENKLMKTQQVLKVPQTYVIDNSSFGMHGSYNGKAGFEFGRSHSHSCALNVNVKRLSEIDFGNNCKFITGLQNKKLVCTKDVKRCISLKDMKKIILQSLNNGIWYVSNVRSDDTLSVRKNAGVKYPKVFELPYNATYINVLAVRMNGKSSWYKIRYNSREGWVNSRFLNHEE